MKRFLYFDDFFNWNLLMCYRFSLYLVFKSRKAMTALSRVRFLKLEWNVLFTVFITETCLKECCRKTLF